jgi:hypothetical protein
MTDLKELNDVSLAILRIATNAKMIANHAHNEVVTADTEGGDEMLFLVDILEKQTRELNERFSAIQLEAQQS